MNSARRRARSHSAASRRVPARQVAQARSLQTSSHRHRGREPDRLRQIDHQLAACDQAPNRRQHLRPVRTDRIHQASERRRVDLLGRGCDGPCQFGIDRHATEWQQAACVQQSWHTNGALRGDAEGAPRLCCPPRDSDAWSRRAITINPENIPAEVNTTEQYVLPCCVHWLAALRGICTSVFASRCSKSITTFAETTRCRRRPIGGLRPPVLTPMTFI